MKTTNYSIFNILFLDIETAGCAPEFHQISEAQKIWWNKKIRRFSDFDENDPNIAERSFRERAAIYAEFGKVICISIGYLKEIENGDSQFIIKTFSQKEEKQLLNSFLKWIVRLEHKGIPFKFCGHNIREFDIPFICRRSLIHKLSLPQTLRLQAKKPWQVPQIIDTLELWRFGDLKHYSSLDLLCSLFEIETPKSQLDGSRVHQYYWELDGLDQIIKYCEKDVKAVMQLYFKLSEENVMEYTTK